MSYRKDGVLYPSKAYYTAKQSLKASGTTATTESMKKAMGGTTPTPTTQPTLESIGAGVSAAAEQVKALQQRVVSEGITRPTVTPDKSISAQDLTAGAGIIEPVVGGDTVAPDANAAIFNTTGIQSMFQTMQTQHEKEISDIKEQQVEKQSMWQKLLGDKKSSAEILKEQYTAVEESPAYKKTQEISAQMEPLNLQIAELSNQETAEIENARSLGMSEGWMNRKETEVHNKYNRLKAPIATQLNAYAANAMLYEGQVDKAYQYADAAVRAAVYDQEFQYNTMRDFMNSNDDFLSSLQESDRNYFSNALNLSAQAYSEAKSDREYVMDLQMQSGGQANITINDTRQEAVAKFANWSGQQPTDFDLWKQRADYEAGLSGGTTTTEGIATGEIEQDLRESVTSIIADLTEGKGTSGFSRTERMAVFNETRKKLRFLYNTKEVSDTAMNNMINQALELKPSTTTTATTIPNISQMTNEQMVNSWLNIDLPTETAQSTQYKR